MDVLEALLTGPRARGAHVLQAVMAAPWSIRVQDRAPLTLVGVVAGQARATTADGTSVSLAVGDLAVFRGPDTYHLADHPDSPPTVVIHPGNRCETLDGEPLVETMALGVRTWGNAADGGTRLLIGTYDTEGAVSRRLLDRLPPLILHRPTETDRTLAGMLVTELAKDDAGQAAVLDRLLDLLLITVLRTWLAGSASTAPSWCAALTDPVVGRALNLIHHHPSQPWTVSRRAAEAGVSRAALAGRFTTLVGEPPISYLTRWRLDLAADLLVDPDLTVEAVGRRVGYDNQFAFSTAFKRARGVSPTHHRRALVLTPAESQI
ncbi:MAG TPA: AraC family transcriptional regulator [Euzebya sp.]|nr:AraC family transcriptional regulator [Euzebya sp.]